MTGRVENYVAFWLHMDTQGFTGAHIYNIYATLKLHLRRSLIPLEYNVAVFNFLKTQNIVLLRDIP